MNVTFEKLWNEYLSEDCAKINTSEETALIKKSVEMHQKASETLTPDQLTALEAYIELLYELQGVFVKKAFLKGCKFTASFFFETQNTK